jgi:PTH1 family peptidyl-tRNA hydrolase
VKLIAGLGNPGKRYAESRHNVGFRVIEELARRWGVDEARYDRHFEALVGQAQRAGEPVLLMQPQTYMNESGRSVAAAWRFYKLALSELLLVLDDLDLPVGRLRLRPGGSSGGHKGLTDVIRCLGSEDFARLRIGIGKVHPSATVEYVLSRFEPDEQPAIAAAITKAADAVEVWLRQGIDAAMNEFNRKGDGPPRSATPPAKEQPAKGDES